MADSSKDYSEILLKSIETLLDKTVQTISFDETIICEIVDNSEAETNYRYKVSDGSTKFYAYSQDTTYQVEDQVYVTIPQGDTSEQKLITGKKVTDTSTPYKFELPFEKMIQTTGNIITGIESDKYWQLLANAYDDIDSDSSLTDDQTKKVIQQIWEIDGQEYQGFTRLGLKASFSTALKKFNTTQGDYGLIVIVTAVGDTVAEETNNTNNDENKSDEDISKTLVYTLHSSDMYGDPYNYNNYFEQSIVFDISNIQKISKIQLLFFQDRKSFKDDTGNLIPYKETFPNGTSIMLLDNIFMKEPYISLGYDKTSFETDELILYSPDRSTYVAKADVDIDKNEKTLNLRWIHEFTDGIRQVTTVEKYYDYLEETLLTTDDPEVDDNYEVRWYRYKLGAPAADAYSGVYWERVNNTRTFTRDLSSITKQFNTYYLIHYKGQYEPDYVLGMQIPYADGNTHSYTRTSFTSLVSQWSDDVLKYYGIAKDSDTYKYGFLMATISSISIGTQTWSEIFSSRFVRHTTSYTETDTWTSVKLTRTANCLHPISLWELLTTAYRFYWQAKTTINGKEVYVYDWLDVNTDIFKYGGSYNTDWLESYASKNPYTELSYGTNNSSYSRYITQTAYGGTQYYKQDYEDNVIIYTDVNHNRYTWTTASYGMCKLLNQYTASFGTWDYVYDDYGRKDFRPLTPEDAAKTKVSGDFGSEAYYWDNLSKDSQNLYTNLCSILKDFYAKTDDPTVTYKINSFSYTFTPDTTLAEEKVKAILLYYDPVAQEYVDYTNLITSANISIDPTDIYRSNIYTFTNDKEVVNKATVDSMSALTINCEDGSCGNYPLYNLGNQIVNSEQKDQLRELVAYFNPQGSVTTDEDGVPILSKLTECEKIQWKIPYNDTMIVLQDADCYLIAPSGSSSASISISGNLPEVSATALSAEPFSKDDDTIKAYSVTTNNVTTYPYQYGYWYKDNDYINIIRYDIGGSNGVQVQDAISQKYYIGATYSPNYSNNTIECSIVKDTTTYLTTKTLTFGHTGTCGTPNTLVLNFENGVTALTAGVSTTVKIIPKLFDSAGKEIDLNNYIKTYYKNSSSNPLSYSWLSSNDDLVNLTYSPTMTADDVSSCYINYNTSKSFTYGNNNPTRNYHVLKVTLKAFDSDTDDDKNIVCDLSAVLPIPIRNSITYQYLSGPTIIAYDTMGNTDYLPTPYRLRYKSQDVVADVTYELWHETNSISGASVGTEDKYYPSLTSDGKLELTPFFVEDCSTKICLTAKLGSTLLWSQPIYIYQNKYPIGMINEWNGKDLVIDEDNGTITATTLAAGKKNADNTFSGVVMGEISDTDNDVEPTLAKHTGVYGYGEGKLSYALLDNGTAFFGQDGRGRIHLDGTDATIYSSNWKNDEEGMCIDLDDGWIKINQVSNAATYATISPLGYEVKDTDGNVTSTVDALTDFNARKISSDTTQQLYVYKLYELLTASSLPTNVKIFYKVAEWDEISLTADTFVSNKYYYYDNDNKVMVWNGSAGFSTSRVYYIPKTFAQVSSAETPTSSNGLYKVNTYYKKIDELDRYVKITSSDIYDPKETYYILQTNAEPHYITLDSQASEYPFAIGTTPAVSERKFRVKWDGTLYATDGVFSGTITAETGKIGGWIIGKDNLHTTGKDSFESSTLGGYLGCNGTMSFGDGSNYLRFDSSGNLNIAGGTIAGDYISIRDGFFSVKSKYVKMGTWFCIGTSDQGGNNNANCLYYGGDSSSPDWENSYIGFRGDASDGEGYYIWCGWNDDARADTSLSSNIFGVASGRIELNATELYCGMDAEHQHGIYARFA